VSRTWIWRPLSRASPGTETIPLPELAQVRVGGSHKGEVEEAPMATVDVLTGRSTAETLKGPVREEKV
jgi:hypothetical protein